MAINYQEIVDQLDDNKIKHLLDQLEIPYKDIGHAFLMPTVCHNITLEDASWKLYYYKNTHVFQCFTHDGSMSIFTFLKKYYETRGIEYDWFNDIYALVVGCSDYTDFHSGNPDWYKAVRDDYAQKKDRKELTTYPSGLLQVFEKYYPIEWLREGISKEAMDKYHILYSSSQNKIIIPHYDINNNLVGIRGRALNEWEIENVGKYMPVQIEGKWYAHPLSLNLYGLNNNQENIRNTGIAIIVEGEKSVLLSENFEMPNCAVASCGSKLNKFQVDLLVRTCHPREIIVAYDKEQLPHDDTYFDKLYQMCLKYKNYAQFSFVYDRSNLLNLKDAPVDCGEETYKKLLATRVKI